MKIEELKQLVRNPESIRSLNLSILSEILEKSKKILEKEEVLLELNLIGSEECYVIGDIHGNLKMLRRILKLIDKNTPKFVVFLGDIVDRGPYQIECLVTVLIHKILQPDKFFLLKGNHETLEMNQYYGFFREFENIYGSNKNFSKILDVYNNIPFCAIINGSVLCVHGGIPENLEVLKQIKRMKTGELSENLTKWLSTSLYQMIWNDPKDISNLTFSESFRGPGIKFFGEKAFDDFMEYNRLNYIIRAHECFQEGYRWFFKERLLSIFTSENYRGQLSPNPASYAVIRSEEIIAKLL